MGKDSLLNNYPPDHPFVTGDTQGLNRILGGWDNTPNVSEYCEEIEEEDEEESRTYDGWLNVGRQVLRGEKSHRSFGKSLFYRSQTKSLESSRIAKCHNCSSELDSNTHKICKECGWMICRECYSCGCG